MNTTTTEKPAMAAATSLRDRQWRGSNGSHAGIRGSVLGRTVSAYAPMTPVVTGADAIALFAQTPADRGLRTRLEGVPG